MNLERKRTLTMSFAGLGDHDDFDDDNFFETYDRLSTAVPTDLASSGSDEDEDYDDSRMSFSSAVSSVPTAEFRSYAAAAAAAAAMSPDYDIWMAAPGSITERRKRLLQGMGLGSTKEAIRNSIKEMNRVISRRPVNGEAAPPPPPPRAVSHVDRDLKPEPSPLPLPSPSPLKVMLVHSRSEGEIEMFSVDRKRKEEILGAVSKQRLTRTSSMINMSHARICTFPESVRSVSPKDSTGGQSVRHGRHLTSVISNTRFGSFFLIKNLDTGKEFIVNEYDQDGMWNKVSDLQTGKKLTMEEFEKCVGHSPVVKELMRRENVSGNGGDEENQRKMGNYSVLSKSLRLSKRRGAAVLKSIKGVAHSMSIRGGENKEIRETSPVQEPKAAKQGPGWVRVRQTAKSYKELSALHLSQEIEAHEGSIWTMKFSLDARFLASGGEDKTIHVWEVQECELMTTTDGNLHPIHPSSATSTPSLGEITPLPSEKKKKKKGSASKKGAPIPEYVHLPETVFSLSDKPVCSFTGHLDDVLDLSWSRSQLLLSSSMDKTVRLWDMETKTCLKMFAHNDYVTCIQFNPMDDNYFISGSLDAKVRIWSIPDRVLVDWTDLHEMVTAVCFTPDGKGALIGSHKGSCRMYSVEDCKLNQLELIELVNSKKKNHAKKITGFQFSPVNPSEVLVTSADSRIRILSGSDVIRKFKGFRNINSQIAASFSLDGKHVICASEDSQVYHWKHEEARAGHAKGKNVINTRAHEHFPCREVSVAIAWPGTVKGDPPSMPAQSKRHSRRSSQAAPSPCGSPTKEDASVRKPSTVDSPTKEETSAASTATATKKAAALPPLPKKHNKEEKEKNNNLETATTPPEEELSAITRTESGIGDSFTSATSSSARLGESPSISSGSSQSSWSSSWSWFDIGGGNQNIQPTAWGLVIVTATLSGEIRVYQNFGLPRRIRGQANLF
ncbi:hypothetical protein Tsubulata_014904 [Turnera subulata]|uniref:Anaphase-promoting complex subunit 4 WD40 domain-containing protein n=1 Tax=Turnera subulata TaxID=218843 RepID=A0A9Q0G3S3_9ROSI|nr:hypothetical protein Tsubulata_014904 [Turnera subulata]